jgi:hypothetical protein
MAMDLKRRPYCSEDEFKLIRDNALDHKAAYDKFNEVLDRVFTRGVEAALLGFPEVAISLMRNAGEMTKLRKEFFDENPDMLKKLPLFKEAVAHLEEKEPALQYKDLLEKAAGAVRTSTPGDGFAPPATLPEPSMGKLGDAEPGIDDAFMGVLKHGK